MEFWLDIAAFALKALLIVAAIGAAVAAIAIAARGKGAPEESAIRFASLDERNELAESSFNDLVLDKKARKALAKQRKRESKEREGEDRKRVFVLSFKGDMGASAVGRLAEQMSAVLRVARPGVDEIALRIHSPGGSVTGYGHAAAEIARAGEHGVATTACVDEVAASGGYMMACAAQKIVAAPFAMLGSIGVVAQAPNFNRLLKRADIDYEEFAAGEHKRSVTIFGENTEAGRAHMREKVEAIHVAFRDWVVTRRPGLDINAVGNGDHWIGTEAKKLGLVDELMTSEEFLFRLRDTADLIEVTSEEKGSLLAQVRKAIGVGARIASAVTKLRQ